MRVVEFPGAAFERWFQSLARAEKRDARVERSVAAILRQVRARGDQALCDFTRRFDGLDLAPRDLLMPSKTVRSIAARADSATVASLKRMARRIEAFHRPQKNAGYRLTFDDGSLLEERVHALESVGLYVPGGAGAYPSSVLMTAIPAQIAGVPRILIATPPGTLEKNPIVAAAIAALGLEGSVLRVGGAQAIGALAFGTESVRAVARIVGPGNAYVAEAKRQVRGLVEIDSEAGPSEVAILADGTADRDEVAHDLVAQAEHGSGRETVMLVTTSRRLAEAVSQRVMSLARGGSVANSTETRRALRVQGAVVVTRSMKAAVDVVNRVAPEHAHIMCREADLVARHVVAGAVFVGRHSPVAVGDYGVGPNHVLPTGGTARFSSPLSVRDFERRSSLVKLSPAGLSEIADDVFRVAMAEGFKGHAASVAVRSR